MGLLRDWYSERAKCAKEMRHLIDPTTFSGRVARNLYALQIVGQRYDLGDRRLAASRRLQDRYFLYVIGPRGIGHWEPQPHHPRARVGGGQSGAKQ